MFTSDDVKSCPLYYAISIIGGKWHALILWHLSTSRTKRYGELKRCIPFGVSHKTFTQQLKELENNDLIIREQYNEVPPRVEYSLTEMGKNVIPIIYALRDWGARWGDFPPETKLRSTGVEIILPPYKRDMDPLSFLMADLGKQNFSFSEDESDM